ncbi:AraC family transcriptional regulator [Mucisphaera calidilacus]|uniref:Xylose operon regulatory protein n=1 Tax=Mucisphaera calidilacus TaxID=2527982 RepID=A0A518BWR6_9BACT|nr:AraC family transcriptional regulator [Mucisphaera calidilacus]QDU71416.1 Xylose operon regulatory protein [Mucisphaera calidilacus]
MRARPRIPANSPTLWELRQCGREHNPAGRAYWFDNTHRQPAGIVVIQASTLGRLVIEDSNGQHHAPQGSLIIFRYGEPTTYYRPDPNDGPYRCAFIGLVGAGVHQHADALRAIRGPVIETASNPTLLDNLDQLIDATEPARGTDPTQIAALAYNYITRLFDHVRQTRREQLPPAQQAVDQLVRQPLAPWSIKRVADRFGISREHLCRVFHERVGETPHAYLSRHRVEAAVNLITQTTLAITDIARQSGYTSTHSLARHVRQHTGHSPTNLRKHKGHGQTAT